MKTIKITSLVCLFAFLSVGYSFSKPPVEDLEPLNIVAWSCGFDYRENISYLYPGYMLGATMYVGGEGISGGYFGLAAVIRPSDTTCLADYSQIREVKAEWLGEPKYEISLIGDTCHNQLPPVVGGGGQAWFAFLRPEEWFFTGAWKFTLVYDCPSDGSTHKQTREVQPNPANTIPPKPSGILIEKVGEYFNVSWIGMGTAPYFGYRIVVYSDENNCPIATLGPGFSTPYSYDVGPNRITIGVPIAYAGKMVRIENRNYYLMPPMLPGTAGATPNRAYVRIRLPGE